MTRVVHCKREAYDVYIGRPSRWGNPFSHKKGTLAKYQIDSREDAIQRYREWVVGQPDLMKDLYKLRGKVLGCWCKPSPCHGDVLAELADRDMDKPLQSWPPRPAELSTWPVQWRLRWGERANQLEAAGVPFPESERRAFREIQAEKAEPIRPKPPRPVTAAKPVTSKPAVASLNLKPQ